MQNTNNIKYLYFSYKDFTSENLTKEFKRNFLLNSCYSLIIKLSSDSNTIFKMAGPQISVKIEEEHNESYYKDLFEVLTERIDLIYDAYDYIDTIDTVLILYSIIEPQQELLIKNINKYNFNNTLVNNKVIKKEFNQNFLPLTLNKNHFGIKILDKEKLELLQQIVKVNNLCKFNFLSEISNIDLYIYNNLNNQTKIIVCKDSDNNSYLRYIFHGKTNIFIKKIRDFEIAPFYFRKIGNLTLKFDNMKVYSYTISNKIEPIKPFVTVAPDINNRLGVLDIETFVDEDNISKIYSLGFITDKDKEPILFYLDESQDSDFLVEKWLNTILINKYNNYIFYAHNFSNYDVVFLYNSFIRLNEKKGFNYYILKTTLRDNAIIKLDISIKLTNEKNSQSNKYNTIKISLRDSMNFLNYSLHDLSKELGISANKTLFPHNFVNKNNLNYIGKKPDISYYIKSKKHFTCEDAILYHSICNDM